MGDEDDFPMLLDDEDGIGKEEYQLSPRSPVDKIDTSPDVIIPPASLPPDSPHQMIHSSTSDAAAGLTSLVPSNPFRVASSIAATQTQTHQPQPTTMGPTATAAEDEFPSLDDADDIVAAADHHQKVPTNQSQPQPPIVSLSQQYPTFAEDFLAPSRPEAFKRSEFVQQKQATRSHQQQQAIKRPAAEMEVIEQKQQTTLATNIESNKRPRTEFIHQQPPVPLDSMMPPPPPRPPAAASKPISSLPAVPPSAIASAQPMDPSDMMSRFLEDDDAIDADEFDRLVAVPLNMTSNIASSTTTSSSSSTSMISSSTTATASAPPIVRSAPLFISTRKRMAIERGIVPRPQFPLPTHSPEPIFQPQAAAVVTTVPSSTRPIENQSQQQLQQQQQLSRPPPPLQPPQSVVNCPPVPLAPVTMISPVSSPMPESPLPTSIPLSLHRVTTPGPKLEFPSGASPSPFARRTPLPMQSNLNTYTIKLNDTIVERTFPGPIGRLRKKVKAEDGTSLGRRTPMIPSTNRATGVNAVDLTTESKEAPIVVLDDEDDVALYSFHDQDIQQSFALSQCLDTNGYSMPTEEAIRQEYNYPYPFGAPYEPRSPMPPPWSFNAHFLTAPNVRQREKIPLFIGVIAGYQLVGLDARILLKDPFGQISATVSCEVLTKYPELLSHHNVLHLHGCTLFHGSSLPHHRSLIITTKNVVRVWNQHEEELLFLAQSPPDEQQPHQQQLQPEQQQQQLQLMNGPNQQEWQS